MSIAESGILALADLLSLTPSITVIVGARISAMVASTGTLLPYMTYRQTSKVPASQTTDGPSGDRIRVTIDMYAKDYRSISALGAAVRALLCPESGTPGAQREFNVSGWSLRVTPAFEQDIYEKDTKLFRINSDYMVWAGLLPQ